MTYYCQFYEVRNVKSGHIADGGCNRGADNFGGKDFVFRSVKRLTFKQSMESTATSYIERQLCNRSTEDLLWAQMISFHAAMTSINMYPLEKVLYQ